MVKEVIVLAGGLGTRLRNAVPDLPKCMAPVAGRPFLFYVINYLRSQGIEKFIFSLGYRHEVIEEYLDYLAVGVANLINIFKPEAILLGGGICKQGENLTTPLKARIKDLAYAGDLRTEIKIAKFARFEKGEGMEKKQDNFAEEVASMMK